MFYFIFHTLPKHNIFHINNEYERYIIDYSFVFILTLTSVYIVPGLINSLKNIQLCNNNRSYFILFFRSLLSIVIPFVMSVIFLNHCGRYWTKLWIDCTGSNIRQKFNYNIAIKGASIDASESVCGVKSWNNINYNSCLREFLDYWIPILTAKLILLIVNPFLLLIVKKYHLKPKLNCCCCCKLGEHSITGVRKQDRQVDDVINKQLVKERNSLDGHEYDRWGVQNGLSDKRNVVLVDSAYSMIGTKLEICIVFGMISPMILFVACVALISSYYAFKIMIVKLNFNIRIRGKYHFPVYSLFVSVIIQQLLVLLFGFDNFGYYIWIVFGICLAVIDVVYLILLPLYQHQRKQMMQKEAMLNAADVLGCQTPDNMH